MEEIARFFHSHPPFDQVAPERLLSLARSVQIEYFPAQQEILSQNGPPAEFFYVLCRGNVDLVRVSHSGERVVDTLGPGEACRYPWLIRQ